MRTFWTTLAGVSVALLFVGLLLGTVPNTADAQGYDCGPAFSSDSFVSDGESSCTGPRAQARQLPVALLLLGGIGGSVCAFYGLRERLRQTRREMDDYRAGRGGR